jgi:hypothetical protein
MKVVYEINHARFQVSTELENGTEVSMEVLNESESHSYAIRGPAGN